MSTSSEQAPERTPGEVAVELSTIVVVTSVAITHEAFLLPHAAAIAAEGHRVVGVANGLPASERARDAYDAVHDLPLGRRPEPGSLLRSARALRRIVRDERADVVWLHTPLASAVGRVALAPLRRRGLQVAYLAHGFHFGSVSRSRTARAFHAIEWALSPVTDLLQTLNQEDHAAALRLPRRTPDNTALTRGVGIDPARFTASPARRAAARADLGLLDGERAVFVVGELNPEKRVDDALAAAAGLPDDVRLFVLGVGPERERLEGVTRSLPGLRATFLGFRRDLPELLQAADALVHPSSREGLPTVVLEAQASGVPVVGAAARGTADLLADGAGLTVPVGDVAALRRAVDRVLHDGELRERLVRAGRERAAEFRVDEAVDAARAVARLVPRRAPAPA